MTTTELQTERPQQVQPFVKKRKKNVRGRWSAIDKISLKKIQILTLDGWTDEKIATFFDISISGLKAYKNKHPKLKVAIKGWKNLADAKVEKYLYKRAIGYKYNEITYEKSNIGGLALMLDNSEIDGIKHTDTAKTKIVVKSVIPDTNAQIFWLKNRQPEQWREKTELSLPGELNLVININTPKAEPEQIRNDTSGFVHGYRAQVSAYN